MTNAVNIVWFRQDLRMADNPALAAAASAGDPVVPLFVAGSDSGDPWAPARRSLDRQQGALARLAGDLERAGSRLVIRTGEPRLAFAQILKELTVKAVFWNRRYEPSERAVEEDVLTHLTGSGVEYRTFDGCLLLAPERVSTTTGTPYRVFTPFWRACLEMLDSAPAEILTKPLRPPIRWPSSSADVTAQPRDDTSLKRRISGILDGYAESRDRPDQDGTSRLSARLHFGEVSPGQVWRAVTQHAASGNRAGESAQRFLAQLVWREFAYHLLYHFPATPDSPLRTAYNRFPWRRDPAAFDRWKAGQSGYPIVDAGMRELALSGWIHNRVRLVVASFLVKHLLIDWRQGAKHFWSKLYDADLANNTLGWQWVAGCGADAAPYFRIFNPVLQGEKFDPDGSYVRRWIPELSALPTRWIHKPWTASQAVLADAGVHLGRNYPHPIVEHGYARQRALDAYRRMRALSPRSRAGQYR